MAQTNPQRMPDSRPDRNPVRLGEDLAPGTVIADTVTNKVLVPILGARVVRIRARVSAEDGTLKAHFVSPADHVTEYATGNPTDVTLTAGTEAVMDIDDVAGEHYLSVQITSAADGMTVDFVDVAQLGRA